MAEINQFQIQSFLTMGENQSKETSITQKVLANLAELRRLKTESQVRDYLKKIWFIKDDIENFNITPNIQISIGIGKKYFNVTYTYLHDEEIDIKSFNYKLEERTTQW